MLKTNQLQSLIALNRARINNLHDKSEVLEKIIPLLKVIALFDGQAKEKLSEAYGIRSTFRKDIAKFVELQKALKAELKDAYAVQNAEKEKVKTEKVIYSFDKDGQPTKNGLYYALYAWHDDVYRSEQRLYKNGKWTFPDGSYTAFGNSATAGERYVAVV